MQQKPEVSPELSLPELSLKVSPDPLLKFPSCRHLELRAWRPIDEVLKTIEEAFIGREFYQVMSFLAMQYEPHCRKYGRICVIMESPTISMQITGGLYRALFVNLCNTYEMEECEGREFPK